MGAAVKGSLRNPSGDGNALDLGPPGSASRSTSCCDTVLTFCKKVPLRKTSYRATGSLLLLKTTREFISK